MGPLIAKKVIDEHIAVAAIGEMDFNPIVKLLAIFFGLAVVTAILRYFQYLLLQNAANRVIQKMRNDLYEHIQTLPIRYFDNLPAGKVVARITNDTEAIRNLYVTVLSQFAISGMYIIGIFIALFFLGPENGCNYAFHLTDYLHLDETVPKICIKSKSYHSRQSK